MRSWLAWLVVCVPVAAWADEPTAAGIEFFEAKIRPLLVEHCYACHSAHAKRIEGGLRLDSGDAILKGGDSGPIVVPRQPQASSLFAAVSYSADGLNMPPQGKLNERAIAHLRQWIELGAPLPQGTTSTTAVNSARPMTIDAAARDFWSFRPLRRHAPPQLTARDGVRRPLDAFVRAQLEQHQLTPAPEADRRTYIRRVSFALLGLPPRDDEIEAFVNDRAPDSYERLLERLLASPRYGERWARHWLDVVRYAEDQPTNESTCKPPRFAYRYRDWVIQALNDDLPYDEFIRRQLAADLLPELPPNERAATGLLGLSPVYHKEPKLSAEVIATIVADEWDERIDTLTRGILGLTVACARCHDHKFDPIRAHDYYALAGVMASTRIAEVPLEPTAVEVARQLQATHDALIDTELRLSYAKTMRKTAQEAGEPTASFEPVIRNYESQLEALKRLPLYSGAIANGVYDAGVWIDGHDPAWTALDFRPGVPRDLQIFRRGNPARLGELAPRRFIEVLSRGEPQPFRLGSGRLELAQALVDDAAALTARVFVNRVWGWHFGQPLVRTPSNFGALGDRPSHPELLDDLAARWIAAGWSLKWLHRELLLSATYRQATVHPLAGTAHDPALHDSGNRLLWRMNRLRLEPEAWRDSVLMLAQELDPSMTGPGKELDDVQHRRRTIYGKISRQTLADVLRLFDFPDAKQHAEERTPTTTPLQQLYLLNSPFLRRYAGLIASQHERTPADSPAPIDAMFQQILQRPPSVSERDAAWQMIVESRRPRDEAWALLAHALLASNELLYLD